MAQNDGVSDARPSSSKRMPENKRGFPWTAVIIAVIVILLVHLSDLIQGFIDGWRALLK